jgi:hypothetical protein
VPAFGERSSHLSFATLLTLSKSPLGASLKPLRFVMPDKIRSYAELRELIRVSLRIQNPEWVAPNGDSPVCDSYDARFAELLGLSEPRENDAA